MHKNVLSAHSVGYLKLIGSLLLMSLPASAQIGYVVTEGPSPYIYEISATGVLSNGNPLVYQSQTNFGLIGLTDINGFYYGLSRAYSGTGFGFQLFSVSPGGGAGVHGYTGVAFDEGDCAWDATTSTLWGIRSDGKVYKIDFPGPPVATLQYGISGVVSDVSAMAFNSSGQMFILDLSTDSLYRINKTTGAVDQTIPLSVDLALGNAAMAFDPSPGNAGKLLVLAPKFNGSSIQKFLFRIDSTTGLEVQLGLVLGGNDITGFVPLPYSGPPKQYCTGGITSNACIAAISASAQPSLSLAGPCLIGVANVEGSKSGIIFYGLAASNVSWGPGSTSFLCVKSPTQRSGTQNSGGTTNACDGSFFLDWDAFQAANPTALGQPWYVGSKAYVQAWFRDPPAPKTTNLSNALELTYQP